MVLTLDKAIALALEQNRDVRNREKRLTPKKRAGGFWPIFPSFLF